MSVREDRILRADGSLGLYGVVDKADFALIIPLDGEGFWLVEQYRYAVQRRAWEFPQGSWNADGGGSPVELAAAELREETGMEADDITHLGHLFGAYGFCSQGFDVYFCHRSSRRLPGPRSERAGHAASLGGRAGVRGDDSRGPRRGCCDGRCLRTAPPAVAETTTPASRHERIAATGCPSNAVG